MQPEFHLNFVDELEASTYMPSPLGFCSGLPEQLEPAAAENISAGSPADSLRQIAIPTPPPECSHHSPDSTHSSLSLGSSISAQMSAPTTSHSYIKGSSLEESPVSSPSDSCAESENIAIVNSTDSSLSSAGGPEMVIRESCIRGEDSKSKQSEEIAVDSHNGSYVPKNIKLPQSRCYLLKPFY